MIIPPFPAIHVPRYYIQEIPRHVMGLFMAMADVLEEIDIPEYRKEIPAIRDAIATMTYDSVDDMFLLVATRETYFDFAGYLLVAADIAEPARFLELASILVEVVKQADTDLFSTARWN